MAGHTCGGDRHPLRADEITALTDGLARQPHCLVAGTPDELGVCSNAGRQRQCRLDQIKYAVDVGVEGVIPLRVSDLLDALVGRLEGGVVDENVESPKRLQ